MFFICALHKKRQSKEVLMKMLRSFWLWILVIVVALVALFFMPPTQSAEPDSQSAASERSDDTQEVASTEDSSSSRLCHIHKTIPIIEASAQHLDQDVLELGLKAYNCAVETGMDEQEVLTLINYTMPSTAKRLWVFDLHRNRILFNTWVAHGKGSGGLMATKFSDQPESHESSIGLFLTGGTYIGKHGNSLILQGLEPGFNDKAEARHIVIHSADYVNKNRATSSAGMGRSWGCPALPPKQTQPIIKAIKDGTLVFSYYPDPKWLKDSKFLNCVKE
jgi:hypothetical protein